MSKIYIGLVPIAFSVVGLLYCYAHTDMLDSTVTFLSEKIEGELGQQSNLRRHHRCSTEVDRKELDKIIGESF